MKNMIIDLVLISVLILLISCDILNERTTPHGKSIMSAEIQGVIDTFSNISASSSMYYGLNVSGTCGNNSIHLNFDHYYTGTHKWGLPSPVSDSIAYLNSMPALLDYGGFMITNFDESKRLLEGSFNFAVIDTSRDTIKVENGRFTIYYILAD